MTKKNEIQNLEEENAALRELLYQAIEGLKNSSYQMLRNSIEMAEANDTVNGIEIGDEDPNGRSNEKMKSSASQLCDGVRHDLIGMADECLDTVVSIAVALDEVPDFNWSVNQFGSGEGPTSSRFRRVISAYQEKPELWPKLMQAFFNEQCNIKDAVECFSLLHEKMENVSINDKEDWEVNVYTKFAAKQKVGMSLLFMNLCIKEKDEEKLKRQLESIVEYSKVFHVKGGKWSQVSFDVLGLAKHVKDPAVRFFKLDVGGDYLKQYKQELLDNLEKSVPDQKAKIDKIRLERIAGDVELVRHHYKAL
jgi:hypothetical protein